MLGRIKISAAQAAVVACWLFAPSAFGQSIGASGLVSNSAVQFPLVSSPPFTCTVSTAGAVAQTHVGHQCICYTTSWTDQLTGGVCSW